MKDPFKASNVRFQPRMIERHKAGVPLFERKQELFDRIRRLASLNLIIAALRGANQTGAHFPFELIDSLSLPAVRQFVVNRPKAVP